MLPRALARRGPRLALVSRRPASSQQQQQPAAAKRLRIIALTGATFLIVTVGTLTGAVLKNDSDAADAAAARNREVEELSLDARIDMLRSRRAGLVVVKMPVERRLGEVREKIAKAEGQRKA